MPSPCDPIWLELFQRLSDRVAHEIKNPLNALAVNVEVLRTRAGRGDGDAAALQPFADASAEAAAASVALVEALLALARPLRVPIDLWTSLRSLVVLWSAIAAADGGEVTLDHPIESPPAVDADPAAVRAALASALEATMATNPRVHCAIDRDTAGVLAVVVRGATAPAAIDPTVRHAVACAGLTIRETPSEIRVSIAAPVRDDTQQT